MKQAIGTKRVNFTPLNRLDYNILRGWDLPADEDGTDEGYLVEYADGGKANLAGYAGYVSWSPKDVFEGSYKASGNLSFGAATVLAKLGYKVARSGWNGSGMFAYIVPENLYPAQTEMIKGVFENDMVPCRAHWALKTAQNDVATWAPSGSDTLVEDWGIFVEDWGIPAPLTFTDRLVAEYKDLKEKSDKLTEFTSTAAFQKVSEVQQTLLNVQLIHMVAYLSVLKSRIDDLSS